jgi:hypothetical protein
VAIIRRTVNRQLWPNEDPIGKRVSGDNRQRWNTVVGIVGDVREFGLDRPPVSELSAGVDRIQALRCE